MHSKRWGRASGSSLSLLLGITLVATTFGGGGASAQTADPAARDAAMRQLKSPQGTGGCVFLSLPSDIRRDALVAALSRQPTSSEFQVAVSKVASRCSGRAYSKADLPLVGAVTGAVRRSAAALVLAQQFGVGQVRLDQAWSTASFEEKATFYAAAEEYLTPGSTISQGALDVAALAAKSGLTAATYGPSEPALRAYFLYTALSERSEALLTSSPSTPAS